ncbi:hypothetical protein BEQ56_12080 [Anaerolineaceae bacterium oral taxon 439]|nr:hypothetical protein BEQ56_12080 [Anaerolineaceae bacterium oral taxon 439]
MLLTHMLHFQSIFSRNGQTYRLSAAWVKIGYRLTDRTARVSARYFPSESKKGNSGSRKNL